MLAEKLMELYYFTTIIRQVSLATKIYKIAVQHHKLATHKSIQLQYWQQHILATNIYSNTVQQREHSMLATKIYTITVQQRIFVRKT